MKYVKIYDEKMQCLGVADIEQNYDKDGYVKLFDATTMKFQGVVDVDDIPESGDNMPVVQVFDENMQPCGVVTADNIRHSDGYLIRLQKDPSTTGAVTGGGRFITGTSVTVVATPDAQSDYPKFDGWYENGTKVSENASYTFTVSGARTLVAKFKETTPIPVQGDVQIFADEDCTQYPTIGESYTTLYARVNVPWGMNEGWSIIGIFGAEAPSTEYPTEVYMIEFRDFESENRNTPFETGEVLVLDATGTGTIPDGTPFIFTKP